MRFTQSARRPAALAALALAATLAVAACTGSPAASPVASTSATPAPTSTASAARSAAPAGRSQTPSSAPASSAPEATPVGTTQTPWGRILDAVPAGFPVFPAATVADAPPDGAVSGAWVSKASVSEVATWYRDALRAANFAKVDLSSALEDGSRVLDVQGDLPECKAQVTVKPQRGTTMISVLFGAGCAGGSG